MPLIVAKKPGRVKVSDFQLLLPQHVGGRGVKGGDVGIGIGSLLMGCLQEPIGLPVGFALTAIAYVIGGVIYAVYVDRYYHRLTSVSDAA